MLLCIEQKASSFRADLRYDLGTITGGSYGTTYNIAYTTNDACPSTSSLEVTTLDEDNSSFELTATCDGATATVTGVEGGTFSFVDAPTDGAVVK